MSEGIQEEMIFKKLTAVGALLALVGGLSIPAQANQLSDEMFSLSSEPGMGYLGYTAYPDGASVDNNSGLIGMKTSNLKVESISWCSSINDPACADKDYFQFVSILPYCQEANQVDCLEGVFATSKDGKELMVNNVKPFSTLVKREFTGSPSINLPSGSVPTLFDIPDAPHSAGTTYMAVVGAYGSWDKAAGGTSAAENGSIAIYAVKIENGSYNLIEMSTDPTRYYQRNWRTGATLEPRCKFTDSQKCAVAVPIPLDIKLGVKVRYGKAIKGWFHGRIQDPTLQYIDNAGGGKTLIASASAVQVPGISIWKKKPELPASVKAFYDKAPKPLGGFGSGAGNLALQQGPEDAWSLMLRNNTGFGDFQMNEFLTWLPVVGDKANMLPTIWTMSLMTNFNSGIIGNTCGQNLDEFTGVVSTNSTQYLAGPPVFNKATDELEYKVAGPHLLPNGDLSRGTYDLTLRADFAKCLYGISGTAFRATISVISDNGQSVNAVTTVGEKNGWLNMSAKGFTYSSPTIKVKLSQDAPTPTPSASTSPSPVTKPVAAKKTSITCVKGKTSKKVTAVNPKCPTGYKKK
jgi:hypothetical protein